jgi:hypothetical protein
MKKLKADELRQILQIFGAESSVFHFAIQKFKYKVIQNCNLSILLCGCKTWSLIVRRERRLRVLENRVLRRILGPNRSEVTKKWKKTTY